MVFHSEFPKGGGGLGFREVETLMSFRTLNETLWKPNQTEVSTPKMRVQH